MYLEGHGFNSCWREGLFFFFQLLLYTYCKFSNKGFGCFLICFKFSWLEMHQSIPSAPMPPWGRDIIKRLKTPQCVLIIPNKHTVLQQPFSFIAQQLRDTFSILMHVCSFLYVIFNVVICYKTIQCYSQGMSSVPPKILLMN